TSHHRCTTYSYILSLHDALPICVLLKGSEVIQDFSNVDTIVFDKTGTLTVGNPTVAATELYEKDSAETLAYLASVERESDHPLRSEEHTSELQSRFDIVCRLLLE